MRSDYALYVVAIIFFVITSVAFALELADFARSVWVVTTAILGLLFIGLGYTQRPQTRTITVHAPSSPPAAPTPAPEPAHASTPAATPIAVEPVIAEVPIEEPSVVVEEVPPSPPSPTKLDLTAVKGIKEKRKQQLMALGINNAEDLANASAKDLAAKLKIAPYFTEKWIENSKKLVGKS